MQTKITLAEADAAAKAVADEAAARAADAQREAERAAKKAKEEKDKADRLAAEKKALEDEVAKVAKDITKCEAAWKLIEESAQMTGIGKTVADMDAIFTEITSKCSSNGTLYKSKVNKLK
jgi:hypothetical protein